MSSRLLSRSLSLCLLTKPTHSHSLSLSPTSLLLRIRLLSSLSLFTRREIYSAAASRAFSTRQTSSSLSDPNPNWSNRPPKETILLDGCDFEHWLVVVEAPQGEANRDEIIDGYIKTLAKVVGSEEEARMKIYSVSTKHYFAFGALVSEELSFKLKELPGVRWVLPDSYLDVRNKDYGGEPFINGEAVPYDPKYHAEWVKNNARANERNRRNDRPRNFDRSRNFERRDNMQNQNRGFQGNQGGPNSPPNMGPANPPNSMGPASPPNMGPAPPNMGPRAPNMGPMPPNSRDGMPYNNMGPNNMGPNNMGPNNMGPNMGPNNMGPNMGPNNMGPNNMGPNNMGPNNMGPNNMGPNNMGPNNMGPNNMGPNNMGPNMRPNAGPNMGQMPQNNMGYAPNNSGGAPQYQNNAQNNQYRGEPSSGAAIHYQNRDMRVPPQQNSDFLRNYEPSAPVGNNAYPPQNVQGRDMPPHQNYQ